MNKKKIGPTDAIVDDIAFYLGREHLLAGRPGVTTYPARAETMDAWRIVSAVLSHPDAAGLFADEHALRAAREQGWDQAVDWIRGDQGGPSGRTTNARLANPYRPAQELPTEDGAVIVPAEGHEFIGGDGGRLFARLTYSGQLRLWYGVVINGGPAWAALWHGEPEKITPGTWKVDDQ